ncbi:hypothetical protein ACHAXS_002610 [Conticribra weissflogii]
MSSSDDDDSLHVSGAMVEVNGVMIPAKPVRPFTAYHIFFQLERNYILQSNGTLPDHSQDVDGNASERPRRYRGVIMPRNWFIAGTRCKKKRKDHKIHGVISFLDLTRTIAKNWRQADGETKHYCRNLAESLLHEYRLELEKYAEIYGQEALDSQKQKRKRRRNTDANDTDEIDSDRNPDHDQDADTDAGNHDVEHSVRACSGNIQDIRFEKHGGEVGNNVAIAFPTESSCFAAAAAPMSTAEINQRTFPIASEDGFFNPNFPPIMRNPLANVEETIHRETFQQPVQHDAVQLSDAGQAESRSSVYPLDNEVQEFLSRICRENDLGGLSASGPSSSDDDSSNHSPQSSSTTQLNIAKLDESVTDSKLQGVTSGESDNER